MGFCEAVASTDHLVPCILSDWPSKDQHFVIITEPTAWRGLQHGLEAPQQDFTRDERAG